MNITEISIKRPSLIIVLFSVFTLLGFIGYKNLSYELMPDFNQPVVVIKTVYPGAEPNEVEKEWITWLQNHCLTHQLSLQI
jgi:HAE1 family hydrophobic/amphiphilic exporter-1